MKYQKKIICVIVMESLTSLLIYRLIRISHIISTKLHVEICYKFAIGRNAEFVFTDDMGCHKNNSKNVFLTLAFSINIFINLITLMTSY